MATSVQVILSRDVPNLGRVGDLCSVKAGYARNYLIPQGKALPASPKRVAEFEHKKRVIEHRRRILKQESEKRAQEIAKIQVTLLAKVGEQGKLFGSIGARDIAKALADEGEVIDHRDIKLENPLKTIGSPTIDLRLEADVTTQFKVVIAPEVVEEEADETEADELDQAAKAGEPDVEDEEDAIAAAEATATEDAAPEA